MKSVRNGTAVCLLAAGLAVASLSTPKAQPRPELPTARTDWSDSEIVAGRTAENARHGVAAGHCASTSSTVCPGARQAKPIHVTSRSIER